MAGHVLMSKNFNPNLSMQNNLVRKSAGMLESKLSSVWERNSLQNRLDPYGRSAPNTGFKICTPVVNKSFDGSSHNADGYETCTPVVNKSFDGMSHNTYSDEYDCLKAMSDHCDVLSSLSINKVNQILILFGSITFQNRI